MKTSITYNSIGEIAWNVNSKQSTEDATEDATEDTIISASAAALEADQFYNSKNFHEDELHELDNEIAANLQRVAEIIHDAIQDGRYSATVDGLDYINDEYVVHCIVAHLRKAGYHVFKESYDVIRIEW